MHYIAGALLLAQFVLMWVLNASIDVTGLEYLAWAVWLAAVTLLAASIVTLRSKGHVQGGRSCIETEALVATGVYALVRMYLVILLFNPNWALAILGILGVACVYGFTRQEEQLLVAKFGESYRRYMQRVPRFNLPAGIIRLLLKRRVEDRGTP
jgi:protein-S-isoprenylcysteine O-methyltransferase Ste14